jgi:polysaccharide pyruvyl transferase WcaK-like protein
MGALESSLPLRPWQTPWALFAVALAGRIHAVPVIFLSVGATPISERLSRWLIVTATRMSSLSTFRDQYSRDAMAKMGAGTSHDLVVPDMAFSLEAPVAHREVVDQVVGVGVMAWHGSNDDRRRSAMIHEEYVATMRQFLTWLLQSGYHVRLFTGDHDDNGVACRLRSEVLAQAAAVEESHVVFEPVSSLSELMSQMSGLYAVVGARYHNVVGALRCAVPTIATGYSEKHRALMESFGQGRFCVDVRNLDLDRLTTTFLSLEREREAVRAHLDTAAKEAGQRVRRQFDELALALGQPNQQLARAWRS